MNALAKTIPLVLLAPARAGAFAAGVLDFARRATRNSAEPVTIGSIRAVSARLSLAG